MGIVVETLFSTPANTDKAVPRHFTVFVEIRIYIYYAIIKYSLRHSFFERTGNHGEHSHGLTQNPVQNRETEYLPLIDYTRIRKASRISL
jgi:hypothetical protein